MADDRTAFEKRRDQKFDGPSISPGTLVEYIPTTAEDKSKTTSICKGNAERNNNLRVCAACGEEVGQET